MDRTLILTVITFSLFCVLFITYAFVQRAEAKREHLRVEAGEVEMRTNERKLTEILQEKDLTIKLLNLKIDSLERITKK